MTKVAFKTSKKLSKLTQYSNKTITLPHSLQSLDVSLFFSPTLSLPLSLSLSLSLSLPLTISLSLSVSRSLFLSPRDQRLTVCQQAV